jgi:hypothetical protein
MEDNMSTDIDTRTAILAQAWEDLRYEEAFADLFQYADLSFPVAFLLKREMIESNEFTDSLVNEAFELLLGAFGIDEDEGFDDLDELLVISEGNL